MSNSTNFRVRIWNPYFYHNWQAVSEENTAADEIIETPEKYLLSQEQLFNAEGGNGGLAIQMLGLMLGVGSVFAMSPRMSSYWKSGSLRWMEWACLTGAGTLGYTGARWVSVNQLGDSQAYHNHWMAYGFVKNCNRWEGRQILTKRPMNY